MPTRLKTQDNRQRNRNRFSRHRRQIPEVERDNHRDECPEQKNELALRHQIGFARLIDQLGDFAHRAMNRQVLQLHIDRQAEQQAAHAEQQSDHQQRVPIHAEKIHGRQIRQHQVRLRLRPRVPSGHKRSAAQQSQDRQRRPAASFVRPLQNCTAPFLMAAAIFRSLRSQCQTR